jgi:hypothetical protein
MNDIHLENKKINIINFIRRNLDESIISDLYENYTSNGDLFVGKNNPKAYAISSNKKLVELLTSSFEKAKPFIGHLSEKNIYETIKNILTRLVEDNKNGAWEYFNKQDILIDHEIYKNLFYDDETFLTRYNLLESYSSNAWNNAICVRALVNWVKFLRLSPSKNHEIFKTIEEGYNHLLQFINQNYINKYPLGFSDFNTTCDTAFILKMALTIQPFIQDFFGRFPPLNLAEKTEFLLAKKNQDGGWPFAYKNDNVNYEDLNKSDLASTCYAVLYLTDILNTGLLSSNDSAEEGVEQGIEYLVNHVNFDNVNSCWVDNFGKLNLEVTSLVLQVLHKNNVYKDVQNKIENFIENKLESNIGKMIEDDTKGLEISFNGNPVRLITLSLITLLKIGKEITSREIATPFSWILEQSHNEERTNVIYIICCISEYLLSKNALLKSI